MFQTTSCEASTLCSNTASSKKSHIIATISSADISQQSLPTIVWQTIWTKIYIFFHLSIFINTRAFLLAILVELLCKYKWSTTNFGDISTMQTRLLGLRKKVCDKCVCVPACLGWFAYKKRREILLNSVETRSCLHLLLEFISWRNFGIAKLKKKLFIVLPSQRFSLLI